MYDDDVAAYCDEGKLHGVSWHFVISRQICSFMLYSTILLKLETQHAIA